MMPTELRKLREKYFDTGPKIENSEDVSKSLSGLLDGA